MDEFIVGVSAFSNANPDLMKAAGIGWIRVDFPFPFVDHIGGTLSPEYIEARETARTWASKGVSLVGVTPLPGIGKFQPDPAGQMRMQWTDFFPAWMGAPGADNYYRAYGEVCSFLAHDMCGMVQAWQIANELDIPQFAGPLNLRQASELVVYGALGLKMADCELLVGTNSAGSPMSYYLFGRLYADRRVNLDYCGVDQYYGSWQAGGPDLWAARIAELFAITETRILVNEWGFSSAGEVMSAEEQRAFLSGTAACQFRKWGHTWGAGHTRPNQAEYVRQAFDSFIAHKEKLIGLSFYRWEDQETCWQCGSPECPIETAWGLVDVANQPKPAYEAFREGVERLRKS